MRNYSNFTVAIGETCRDLKEMGVKVHTMSYQDKIIDNDPDFEMYELTNYIYTVTLPNLKHLQPTQPWADQEFNERIGLPVNPGKAWESRPEVWTEFLDDGQFHYTYSERMNTTHLLNALIENLGNDMNARQHFLAIWNPEDIHDALGHRRIPCSLGYYFQSRQNALDMTYLQRSADFATHFMNDIYLAFRLQKFVAETYSWSIGHFTHWIGSLHVFEKDVQGVF